MSGGLLVREGCPGFALKLVPCGGPGNAFVQSRLIYAPKLVYDGGPGFTLKPVPGGIKLVSSEWAGFTAERGPRSPYYREGRGACPFRMHPLELEHDGGPDFALKPWPGGGP